MPSLRALPGDILGWVYQGVVYMGASIQGGIPGLPPRRDLGPGMSHPTSSVLTSSDSHQSR